jgi:hypothetical protein
MKNRYEFTIEDLNCYTITLEVETYEGRDPNLEEDEVWNKFNNLEDGWYEHPTRVDAEGGCNVDIQMYGPIKETKDE